MARKKLFTKTALSTAAVVAGLTLPHHSRASTPETYVAYGINPSTAKLHRYDFASGQSNQVGPVLDSSGGTLHGIEASAHFPGFQNIYAFWNDHATGLTRLVFVDKQTGVATYMGYDLGEERVTGAVAVHPAGTSDYDLYAMQDADTLPFEIVGDTIVPNEPLSARITVLGAAISYSGSYDMPVTLQVKTGATVHEPFGDYTMPIDATVNDGNNPRGHVLPGVYSTGDPISVLAKSWKKKSSTSSGVHNSHWENNMEVDSDPSSPQVIILRDGDVVPNIPAFMDQASVEQFLVEYIDHDTHTMDLGPNQAVYLFELGTTDLSSSAADFQDLVMLLTFSEEPADLTTNTSSHASIGGTIKVNPNNSWKNRFELTKPDTTTIDRDDLHAGAPIDANGVLYSGPADKLRIRPTGNGKQSSLTIGGVVYEIDNGTTYEFSVPGMNVTVRNDHPHNGQAMGHWWVDLSGAATDVQEGDGTDDPASNSQLIKVDQTTGEYETLMIMNRPYAGLASIDGQVFYAVSGKQVYKIDSINKTETLLKDHFTGNFTGLGFAGTTLYAFGALTDMLYPLSTATGSVVGLPVTMGVADLGTVVFTPASIEKISNTNYD